MDVEGFVRGLEALGHREGGVARERLSGPGHPKLEGPGDAGHLKGGVVGKRFIVSGTREKLEERRGGPS